MERPASTARGLALLAALSSPVFMAGAIAGWATHFWPATPLTFGVAAAAVLGGPVLGLLHVLGVRPAPPPPAPPRPIPSRPPPVHPEPPVEPALARSRAFLSWRDNPPRRLAAAARVRAHARRRTVSGVRPEPKQHDHLA